MPDADLTKQVPAAAIGCAHALASWVVRPGRLLRQVAPCVLRPGHDHGPTAGAHRTADGRQWT